MQDSRQTGGSPAALVSSDDVVGTPVHARDGTEVGHIDHVMIDMVTGKIAYAVMAFGGVLGFGEEQHPVPWGAPARSPDWTRDRDWERAAYDHYGVPFYWV